MCTMATLWGISNIFVYPNTDGFRDIGLKHNKNNHYTIYRADYPLLDILQIENIV